MSHSYAFEKILFTVVEMISLDCSYW